MPRRVWSSPSRRGRGEVVQPVEPPRGGTRGWTEGRESTPAAWTEWERRC